MVDLAFDTCVNVIKMCAASGIRGVSSNSRSFIGEYFFSANFLTSLCSQIMDMFKFTKFCIAKIIHNIAISASLISVLSQQVPEKVGSYDLRIPN